ncbi:MAG: phospholipase, partial [Leptospira sp.]|nr:phospholipase [Leptospira sp.]
MEAWTDHTLGTYSALAFLPEVKNAGTVKVESFEDFLKKENKGLAKLLKEQEDFARRNIQNYPPKPDSISFNENDLKNIRKIFLRSLRLNPEIKIAYYIQELPGTVIPASEKIPPKDITVFKDISFISRLNFRTLKLNSQVSPVAVLATASDEPDYGHDIGLFTDNGTEYGKVYSFGEQPFGDKRFEYGSQA